MCECVCGFFFFFLASLTNCLPEVTKLLLQLGGVLLGATSEQHELGLAGVCLEYRAPVRNRCAGKQPAAIQMISSPDLHLFNSNGAGFHKCSQALNGC